MSSLFKDAIEGISAAAGTAVAVTQSLYGSLTGSAKKAPPPNASDVAREEAVVDRPVVAASSREEGADGGAGADADGDGGENEEGDAGAAGSEAAERAGSETEPEDEGGTADDADAEDKGFVRKKRGKKQGGGKKKKAKPAAAAVAAVKKAAPAPPMRYALTDSTEAENYETGEEDGAPDSGFRDTLINLTAATAEGAYPVPVYRAGLAVADGPPKWRVSSSKPLQPDECEALGQALACVPPYAPQTTAEIAALCKKGGAGRVAAGEAAVVAEAAQLSRAEDLTTALSLAWDNLVGVLYKTREAPTSPPERAVVEKFLKKFLMSEAGSTFSGMDVTKEVQRMRGVEVRALTAAIRNMEKRHIGLYVKGGQATTRFTQYLAPGRGGMAQFKVLPEGVERRVRPAVVRRILPSVMESLTAEGPAKAGAGAEKVEDGAFADKQRPVLIKQATEDGPAISVEDGRWGSDPRRSAHMPAALMRVMLKDVARARATAFRQRLPDIDWCSIYFSHADLFLMYGLTVGDLKQQYAELRDARFPDVKGNKMLLPVTPADVSGEDLLPWTSARGTYKPVEASTTGAPTTSLTGNISGRFILESKGVGVPVRFFPRAAANAKEEAASGTFTAPDFDVRPLIRTQIGKLSAPDTADTPALFDEKALSWLRINRCRALELLSSVVSERNAAFHINEGPASAARRVYQIEGIVGPREERVRMGQAVPPQKLAAHNAAVDSLEMDGLVRLMKSLQDLNEIDAAHGRLEPSRVNGCVTVYRSTPLIHLNARKGHAFALTSGHLTSSSAPPLVLRHLGIPVSRTACLSFPGAPRATTSFRGSAAVKDAYPTAATPEASIHDRHTWKCIGPSDADEPDSHPLADAYFRSLGTVGAGAGAGASAAVVRPQPFDLGMGGLGDLRLRVYEAATIAYREFFTGCFRLPDLLQLSVMCIGRFRFKIKVEDAELIGTQPKDESSRAEENWMRMSMHVDEWRDDGRGVFDVLLLVVPAGEPALYCVPVHALHDKHLGQCNFKPLLGMLRAFTEDTRAAGELEEGENRFPLYSELFKPSEPKAFTVNLGPDEKKAEAASVPFISTQPIVGSVRPQTSGAQLVQLPAVSEGEEAAALRAALITAHDCGVLSFVLEESAGAGAGAGTKRKAVSALDCLAPGPRHFRADPTRMSAILMTRVYARRPMKVLVAARLAAAAGEDSSAAGASDAHTLMNSAWQEVLAPQMLARLPSTDPGALYRHWRFATLPSNTARPGRYPTATVSPSLIALARGGVWPPPTQRVADFLIARYHDNSIVCPYLSYGPAPPAGSGLVTILERKRVPPPLSNNFAPKHLQTRVFSVNLLPFSRRETLVAFAARLDAEIMSVESGEARRRKRSEATRGVVDATSDIEDEGEGAEAKEEIEEEEEYVAVVKGAAKAGGKASAPAAGAVAPAASAKKAAAAAAKAAAEQKKEAEAELAATASRTMSIVRAAGGDDYAAFRDAVVKPGGGGNDMARCVYTLQSPFLYGREGSNTALLQRLEELFPWPRAGKGKGALPAWLGGADDLAAGTVDAYLLLWAKAEEPNLAAVCSGSTLAKDVGAIAFRDASYALDRLLDTQKDSEARNAESDVVGEVLPPLLERNAFVLESNPPATRPMWRDFLEHNRLSTAGATTTHYLAAYPIVRLGTQRVLLGPGGSREDVDEEEGRWVRPPVPLVSLPKKAKRA